MNKFYIRGLNKIYQRSFKLAPLKSPLPLRERARVRGFSQVSSSFGISRIVSIIFVITLSLNVAYAEDIELVFKKDEGLNRKHFELFPNLVEKEIFLAKYDLNDDGKDEYIMKAKFKKPCSGSLRPTCIEIVVFDNDFKMISQDYVGFNETVKVLEVKHGGYNDILLNSFHKKKIHTRILKFNTTYQKYDILE
jgi:hypothetical protein